MRPKIQLLILLMYSMTLSRKGPTTVVWALILELSKSFKLSPEWPCSYTHNSCGYANEDSQTSTLRTVYTACHVNLQSSSVKLSIGLTKCIISSNNLIVPWVTILVRLSFWNRLGKPMERSVLRQMFFKWTLLSSGFTVNRCSLISLRAVCHPCARLGSVCCLQPLVLGSET